eukprot:NODE_15548_length_1044_cov_4.439477.p1 GENE.NODE_15548_length_1044_cov_4.439477~~NODE_15548_length_1044_cov_4.439477.p1  ORF type:complete len:230 (-),score=44.26 NODE_15548_length_1044_cov_4.439477:275-964(-)
MPTIGSRVTAVQRAVAVAAAGQRVRLVAVSKTHPVEAIKKAYDGGQRTFGESYVQELVQKVPQAPADIRWRFIGRLQRNKVRMLLRGCPTLTCIETVHNWKLAGAINRGWASLGNGQPLPVFVQVNTSGEAAKSGVAPVDAVDLCRKIDADCKALELAGLMTIGTYGNPGPDFQVLSRCREEVAKALGVKASALELSMGMSDCFAQAINEGSTSVRVGTTIFGERDYSK